MLGQLLEFINNLSIDEKLYWRVEGCEIFWLRSDKPKPWSMRRAGDESAKSYTGNELLKALMEHEVDMTNLERQIGVSVLTQAVFADMIVGAAKQLFGDEVVAKSIADTRTFLASLTTMAQAHSGASGAVSAQPRLRLVTDKLH